MDTAEVKDVRLETSETSGPNNFTEGSLVAMMKREGIGRPSTYGSTIERLLHRQYIRRDDRSILPTERGRDVIDFLRRAVPKICEIDLTESMERTLDQIARGKDDWTDFVERFDEKLDQWLEAGEDLEPEGSAETRKELFEYEVCPRCGEDLYLREGQYGEFVHCSSDDCDFSSNPPAKTYRCPECDRHMVKQKGNRSTVYHCIAHPDCEGRRPVGEPNMTYEEFQDQAPDCPECDGKMVKRKGRYGTFWGCENYPDCEATQAMD
jgi:DNA topoisomerase-1